MLVCKQPKFIYLMPGRTASYSIFQALLKKYPLAVDLPPHHGYTELPDRDESCLMVSIREPFSRAVSMWRLMGWHVASPWWTERRYRIRDICKSGGFRGFLTDPWLRSSGVYAPIWPQLVTCKITPDYYIRYETLRRDMQRLPFLKKGEKIDLLHLHKSQHVEPWHSQYADASDLVDIVLEIYKDDFQYFDYSMDLQQVISEA